MSKIITGKTNPLTTTLKNGLVSYYSMDEPFGNTIYDSHGSNNGSLFGSLTKNLVSYWSLNNTNESSDLHSSNNGTVTGGVTFTSDGAEFDGSTGVITVPNDALLNITGNITVSIWVYINALSTNWCRLIGKGDLTNRTYGVWYHGSNKYVLFQIFSTSGNMNAQYTSTETLTLNRWYHFVGVNNGSTVKLYINGNEMASTSYTGAAYSSTEPLNIGYHLSSTYGDWFDGKIKDACIFNKALTTYEVSKLYREGIGIPYPLEDACYVSSNGKVGKSIEFKNVEDSIDLGTSLDSIKTSSFSVCFWVNPNETNTGRIFSSDRKSDSTGSDGDYGIGMTNALLYFYYRGASTVSLNAVSALTTGTWSFVTMVRDIVNGTRKIYINGTVNAELTSGDTFTASGTENSGTSIGDELQPNAESNRSFRGLLDEVAIWDRVLTQSEITELYNSGNGKTYKNLDTQPKNKIIFGKN